MKNKGTKKSLKIFACIIAVIMILHCTPGMALRSGAFLFDIGSAFTMKFEKVDDVSKHKSKYIIRENEPVEKSTQGELTTWMVYHFGPFNYAYYYGEC